MSVRSFLSRRRICPALAAIAFVLVLAGMPDRPAADALQDLIQQCKDEWNKSSASQSCFSPQSTSWVTDLYKCQFSVNCPKANNALQWNENVQVFMNWVSALQNCDGRLATSC